MAGDWIKVRTDLHNDPRITGIAVTLASRLSVTCVTPECDAGAPTARTVSHCRTLAIGGMITVWSLFDTYTGDGVLQHWTSELIDEHVGVPGFAAAAEAVGWLEVQDNAVVMPRFDTHMSDTAKRRAQATRRKQRSRSRVTQERDQSVTREEKRREEKRGTAPTACTSGATDDDLDRTIEGRFEDDPNDRALRVEAWRLFAAPAYELSKKWSSQTEPTPRDRADIATLMLRLQLGHFDPDAPPEAKADPAKYLDERITAWVAAFGGTPHKGTIRNWCQGPKQHFLASPQQYRVAKRTSDAIASRR